MIKYLSFDKAENEKVGQLIKITVKVEVCMWNYTSTNFKNV